MYIILAFLVYVLSNGVWCIPAFSWIYPVLFLFLLHSNHTRRMYFIIFSMYTLGFLLQFENVIGMDLWICVLVSIFLASLKSLPYLFWMKSKMNFKATLIFPAAMVIVEYAVSLAYPILGGLSDAYTQYRNIYLLQIVTITGIYGIIFVMNWTAIIIVWMWNNRYQLNQIKKYIFVYISVIGLVFFYGVILFQFGEKSDKSVRIAGVTVPVTNLLNEDKDVYSVFYTDSFTYENKIHTKSKLLKISDELFLKTEKEAQAGAKIVFWSELNGAVLKEDEPELLQKASDTAKKQEIYLIVSLLVKTPYKNLKENKIAAFNPQGKQMLEYFKYGRSIGELCLKGDGKLNYFDSEYGKIAPFICSDLAFIPTIRQAGKNSLDILLIPASDWKEMTEIAIKTAVIRGVENGCNIMRHTNQGMSVVSDTRGNILALSDYFKSDTKALASQVSTSGRFTLYPHIGDAFVCVCGICLIGMFFSSNSSKRPADIQW